MTENTVQHIKWPSIENFHNVYKSFHHVRDMQKTPKITYVAKPKLHGTNAAIQYDVRNDRILSQKRTGLITPEDDNLGFARWVDSNSGLLLDGFRRGYEEFVAKKPVIHNVVFHGEWVGPGIQKNTPLNQIPNKTFCVYAVEVVYEENDVKSTNEILYDPSYIMEGLEVLLGPDFEKLGIKIIPYARLDFNGFWVINFYDDKEKIQVVLDNINQLVKENEICDAWVKRTWGIEGPGEGFVFYPLPSANSEWTNFVSKDFLSAFMFKAKGEEHRVAKDKESTRIDPELLRKSSEFAEKFVTESRCLQAVDEGCKGEYNVSHTGNFLKWLVSDIYKEAHDELEASGIEWKKVSQACASKGREWYMKKCHTL